MSFVTRRKHVMKEMINDDFELPKETQQIVRVTSSCGNNLHKVEASDDTEQFLVSMPVKFRKNVWVKRGDFLVVERIEEGDKVKAEICKILTAEHIKEFTKAGIWPKKFTKKREHSVENLDYGEEDGDTFRVRNLNRPQMEDDSDSEEDETDSNNGE